MGSDTIRDQLDALDSCYAAALDLPPAAVRLADDPSLATAARAEYARVGFARIPGAVSQPAIERLADALWTILWRLAFEVALPHAPAGGQTLTSGGRLRRIDPGSLEAGQAEQLARILSAIGIEEFGRLLHARFGPVVEHVVGRSLCYERVFVNLYEEGDYLSPHNDEHMGDRIDVNFSVSLATVCGLRVLAEGFLETHYDGDGTMSILGPRVWHEVPPLLRVSPDEPPRRVTITLRYC